MKAKVRIYILFKPELPDAHGISIRNSLRAAGFDGVDEVRAGKIIELEIDIADKTKADDLVKKMCQDLLAHPFSETYTYTIEFE